MPFPFPDDATGEVLCKMVASGWDLERPMTVDFFAVGPTEAVAARIGELARAVGFRTELEFHEPLNGGSLDGKWTSHCHKQMLVSYESLSETEREVEELARRAGGYGDGFESSGNKLPN